MKEKTQYELQDIYEMIHRFVVSSKHGVSFVGSFIGFDKNGKIRDNANRLFAYGYKEDLREMLNELRDMIEDSADDDDWVNL